MDNAFPPEFASAREKCAVDFDGVLHDDYLGYHDGTCYGPAIEGSADGLKELAGRFEVVVFTAKARTDRPLVNGKSGRDLVWEWLSEQNISQYVSDVTAEKPRASFYLDDRAIRFENWKNAIDQIRHAEGE